MADSFHRSEDSLKTLFAAARAAYKQYHRELGIIYAFFLLAVMMTNLAHTLWGFKLLEFFELTFDAFHNFCQRIMNVLVFSWISYLLEWLWYWSVWLCSLFLHVIPWRPRIIIPGWVTDGALISLALTRVFESANLIVPRQDREKAEAETTPEFWGDIRRAEGPFWGPIHRFVERANAGIRHWIDAIHRRLTYPIRGCAKCSKLVRQVLISLAGCVLLWGFIRLIGYTINVGMAGRLSIPIMYVRRRLFKYFLLNLFAATAASAMFIYGNGWLLAWMRRDLPIAP